MAKHSSHILALARRGAEHRLAELQAEIASLIKGFPHLRSSRGRPSRSPHIDLSAVPAAMLDQQSARKRKPLSAAARRRISNAQKARWAKFRKATKM